MLICKEFIIFLLTSFREIFSRVGWRSWDAFVFFFDQESSVVAALANAFLPFSGGSRGLACDFYGLGAGGTCGNRLPGEY